jgi:hypothetical protein
VYRADRSPGARRVSVNDTHDNTQCRCNTACDARARVSRLPRVHRADRSPGVRRVSVNDTHDNTQHRCNTARDARAHVSRLPCVCRADRSPGVFYTCFYNPAHRLRLEKLL